jgi:hypothetical protein
MLGHILSLGDFTMKKFLILYLSQTSAREEMAGRSPEQAKAGMDAWLQWARQAGNALVELGAPLADVGGKKTPITGFSILQANSPSEIDQLLSNHPHKQHPNATIEVHEFIELPGMSQGSRERELAESRR